MHVLIPPSIQARMDVSGLPGIELSRFSNKSAPEWWVYQSFKPNEIEWAGWIRSTYQSIGPDEFVALAPELDIGETKAKIKGRVRTHKSNNLDLWTGLRTDARGELWLTQMAGGKLGSVINTVNVYRDGA